MENDKEQAWRKVERALRTDDPGLALQAVVKDLLDTGVEKEVLLARMKDWVQRLRKEAREADEDVVLDVMDLLVGWGTPGTRL